MIFLAPAWLLGLFLVPLLIWLHSRRIRSLVVPSLMLWRLVDEAPRAARSRFPRIGLPLLLQILVVTALALALAQPHWGHSPQTGHRVYVLDASGSMRATDVTPSRFERARSALEDLLARRPPTIQSRVSVILAGPEARLLAARIGEGAPIGPDELVVSDGTADWQGVADLLPSIVRAGEPTELVILTDGADDGAAGLSAADTMTFATGASGNVAIEATASRAGGGGEQGWTVQGRVRAAGAALPASVAIHFRAEGGEAWLDWATIPVGSPSVQAEGNEIEATFSAELVLPRPGILRLAIPDDTGPHDNAAFFVVTQRRVPRVLIVGDVDPSVVRALQSTARVSVSQSAELPENDASFDLVIVDNAILPRAPDTNTLWLGSGRLGSAADPPLVADPYPTSWRSDHPLAHSVEWGSVVPGSAFQFAAEPGSDILFEAGEALLVWARTTAVGREVHVAIDLTRSNWVRQPAFAVFAQNLVEWLGLDAGDRTTQCTAGEPCAIDPRLLAGTVTEIETGSPVPLVLDLGRAWVPHGLDRGFVPTRGGLYRVAARDRSELVAVNAPSSEFNLVPGAEGSSRDGGGVSPQPSLWRWLAIAGLVLLVVEAAVAARTGKPPGRRDVRAWLDLSRRERVPMVLRLATVVLILGALLGPLLPLPERTRAVVLVVPEVGDARRSSVANAALQQFDATEGVAVVTSGRVATLAADFGASIQPGGTAPIWSGRDLERALNVAAAAIPDGVPGRIVLFSDGTESAGDVGRALSAIRSPGIAVDIVPTARMASGAAVRSVEAPSHVFAGDAFTVNAIVDATEPLSASVSVLLDGVSIATRDAVLQPGSNRLQSAVPEAGEGRHLYEVAVTAEGDADPVNDRNGTFVEVHERPSVLIVTPQITSGAQFAEALDLEGFRATEARPDRAPFYMDEWLAYDAVALLNVPAIDLTTRQQEQLRQYVGEFGRGLLLLGGENSFGPGGYYQTPLEDISPLSARVPRDAPKAALVFVLDRSGSMQQRVGEVTRLTIAKEATLAAVDLLHEESQVGIVVFDSASSVIVPLQTRKDVPAILEALGTIDPAGGTAIYPGLVDAFEQLRDSDAAARHIVVMTDGLSQPADFSVIVGEIAAAGITVSTVAIGDGADIDRLEEIARLGGGAFHSTTDFEALPGILSQEALLLSGSPTEERVATPTWTDRATSYRGTLPARMPAVEGYVLTAAKPDTDVLMTLEDKDGETAPLLASWRYGSGQVAALATQAIGPWTAEWTALAGYPLIAANMIRRVLGTGADAEPEIELMRRGDAIEITLPSALAGGRGELPLVTLVRPSDEDSAGPVVAVLPLRRAVDGRLHGTAIADRAGTYVFQVADGEARFERAIHVGHSAEHDPSRANADILTLIAEASGGRVSMGGVTLPDPTWRTSRVPGWPLLLLLSLGLFAVEMIVRYRPTLPWRRFGASAGMPK